MENSRDADFRACGEQIIRNKTMKTEDSLQCSHCGSSDSVDVRFAACVATSRW